LRKEKEDTRKLQMKKKLMGDGDFFIYISEEQKKYLIATKYKFFAEASVREIHGGATPEEVLVPVILHANKDCRAKILC